MSDTTRPAGAECDVLPTRESKYPQRAAYFANQVCRSLHLSCAAQEIGPLAALLVTVIALAEDAMRYRRAATFWDSQLVPMVGAKNQKAIAKARSAAVEAGWLHYEPGSKSQQARYWVIEPPKAQVDDASSTTQDIEDSTSNLTTNPGANRGGIREPIGDESGNLPIPNPIPNPKPKEEAPCAAHIAPPAAAISPEPEPASQPTRSRKGAIPRPEDVPIPATLDTPAFRSRWAEWITDRRARRKPMTASAARMALDRLEPFGPAWASERIAMAIERGWTGLVFREDKPTDETGTFRNGRFAKELRRRITGHQGRDDDSTCGQSTAYSDQLRRAIAQVSAKST